MNTISNTYMHTPLAMGSRKAQGFNWSVRGFLLLAPSIYYLHRHLVMAVEAVKCIDFGFTFIHAGMHGWMDAWIDAHLFHSCHLQKVNGAC